MSAGPPEPDLAAEPAEVRLRRLRMRSWRRGMREMDLILGPFADADLGALPADGIERFEDLLTENDQDLYPWFTGQLEAPARHAEILQRLRQFHGIAAAG